MKPKRLVHNWLRIDANMLPMFDVPRPFANTRGSRCLPNASTSGPRARHTASKVCHLHSARDGRERALSTSESGAKPFSRSCLTAASRVKRTRNMLTTALRPINHDGKRQTQQCKFQKAVHEMAPSKNAPCVREQMFVMAILMRPARGVDQFESFLGTTSHVRHISLDALVRRQ